MAINCPKCQTENPDSVKFCSECGTALRSSKDISVTKTLQTPTREFRKDTIIANKYKIIEKLGEGGMGVVYRAKDTRLERTVALKFLPSELTQDKEAKKRFIQEAQAAAALNHPHICIIHEVDDSDDQTFIAMEFIEGQTLKEKIETGPLGVEEAADIAFQVAEGLGEAHKKGIIHRDIKPANIMLSENRKAKIMDFGLAKLSWGADLTMPSMIMGTVAYMSPEQARGEEVDHRTDIWSLGAMLYEMLSGGRPFQKTQEQALIYAILNDKPTPLSLLRSDIPTHIEQVVEKALVKKVNERYQKIEDLINDLKEAPSIIFPKAEKSIVVLPFDDLSPDRDQEYFSDGLTEEVISDLSGLGALRVISRSSAMTFKGTKKTAPEIAKQLKVQYVLEGSVRKAGNNLRITAQLIDAIDDTHIWADKYSGTLEDVFDIQEKVSRSIVEALKIKLSPEENKRIREVPIDNIKAYEYYFKARQAMGYWTEPEFEEAIRYLEKGLEIIGENALLYSQLGYIHYQFWNLGYRTEEISLQKASKYAKKIEKIDTDSIHGFFLKGTLEMAGGSIKKCLRYFQRVINDDPNHSEALFWTSIMLGYIGKTTSAISFYERVVKIDPLNMMSPFLPLWIKIYEGRFEDALEPIQKLYESNPDYVGNLWLYIWIHVYLCQQDKIFVTIEKIENEVPDTQYSRLFVLLRNALQGEKLKSLHPDLEKWARKDASYSYTIAQCFALVDDKERAFDWIETCINLGGINYPFLNEYDPLLENLRCESRFKKLMERIKHEWENFEV